MKPKFINAYKERRLDICIENLSEVQAQAVEDMLATWEQFGKTGASHWTAIFVDGDGDFHPTIIINGHRPRQSRWLSDADRVQRDEYRVNPETIAIRLAKNLDDR